jgi:hypothetical protein
MLSPLDRASDAAPLLALLALSRGLRLSFSHGSYALTETASSSIVHESQSLSELEAFALWLPLASASLLLPPLRLPRLPLS